MNRILAALLLVALSFTASAEVWHAKYGVAETFNFKLYNADGTLDVDEVDAGTEVSLSCDEGAETTATNDFADEGNFYSIALTAAELKCERVAVVVAATTTEVFFIQTSATDPAVVAFGTLQSATGTTAVLAAATSLADDLINGATLVIAGGTGAGQSRVITDWVSATDTATVATWTTNPDNTSVYEVYQTPSSTFAASSITSTVLADGAITAAKIPAIEQATLADAAVLNCTTNTANFAGSTTTVACILTDRDGGAVTVATGDLEGRELLVLSGTQIYEGRFITDTTWDGVNSELQLTLSRALPGTLADAVTAIIR
jgi:hypothetical protein